MENKIKHYREKHNLTQSELAEKSGVSLRTIQRIERGSLPKGHTLKAVAKALELSPESLGNNSIDIERVKLINISSLSFFIIPFGNVFIAAYLTFRSDNEESKQMGKDIISVQIYWSIITSLLLIISPFIQKFITIKIPILVVFLVLLIGANIFIIFKNAISLTNKSKLYMLPKFRII